MFVLFFRMFLIFFFSPAFSRPSSEAEDMLEPTEDDSPKLREERLERTDSVTALSLLSMSSSSLSLPAWVIVTILGFFSYLVSSSSSIPLLLLLFPLQKGAWRGKVDCESIFCMVAAGLFVRLFSARCVYVYLYKCGGRRGEMSARAKSKKKYMCYFG